MINIKSLKRFYNIHKNEKLILVCNGPSLNKINFEIECSNYGSLKFSSNWLLNAIRESLLRGYSSLLIAMGMQWE